MGDCILSKCPNCNEPQQYSKITYWKGCERCRFGEYQYYFYEPDKGGDYAIAYSIAMRRAMDKLEVDNMCKGVL